MMFWIIIVSVLAMNLMMFGFLIKFIVTEVRDLMFIKEYRRTNEWNAKAPEYLKYMVIPNEEYEAA